MKEFDIIIIGGGLSGSSTALNLSKKGYYAVPDETFDGSVRFVSAWNTTEKDIDKLVKTIKEKL